MIPANMENAAGIRRLFLACKLLRRSAAAFVAVESVVQVVIAAALAAAALGNAERALDTAHRGADAQSDRAADGAADRSGRAIALMRAAPGTLLGPPEYALCF